MPLDDNQVQPSGARVQRSGSYALRASSLPQVPNLVCFTQLTDKSVNLGQTGIRSGDEIFIEREVIDPVPHELSTKPRNVNFGDLRQN